ncbi:LHFPL tetraspan subfamily member 7 protein-like [Ranitomeya variabilis]|uniref:LHFPL tetraspan subfamily member 7 protein-like n=1 Tax=Ranitomeya variabilis TaxID=490064 RepID=UPI004056C004
MRSLLDSKKKSSAGLDVALGLVPQQQWQRQPRMFSCVSCFWVLLSACLVAVCSFSFLSPAWIVRSGDQELQEPVSFGLLWHCSDSLEFMSSCYTLGGLGRFNDIPSSSWQTSAVLCCGGCALLVMSCLLAIVTLFLPSGLCERRLCTLAGYMQTAAVFIMASGLLVYPFGLNSATVKKYCENSSIYYAGDCQIGWGYMLAIVGVMLSVFLPFFAKYAPKEHISPTPIPTIL